MSINLEDFSKILNLSPATISKALNGYSDVSSATIERVQKYAQELGYQPSSAARNLRLQKTYRIGLVNPTTTFSGDYFMEILKGATSACENAGYNIVLYTTALEHPDVLQKACTSKEIDGLLIFGGGNIEQIINELNSGSIPVIIVGRQTLVSSYSYIAPDDVQGSYLACRHLIISGHTKVAFIGQEADSITHQNRLKGYKNALEEYGMKINDNYVVSAPFLPPGGYIAMKKMMNQPDRPTGIISFNDAIAIEGMAALNEMGIRVPEDVSLIGYDNTPICEKIVPTLTSVDIPLEEIGRQSVKMVLDRLNDPTMPRECRQISTKLIIRGSTSSIK